jgi:hypothetical protein
MANNFVDAVNEHRARLQAAQPADPNAIIQAAAEAILPAVADMVQKNNVAFARVIRENPGLIVKR